MARSWIEVSAWYRATDREFLRREAARTVEWIVSGRGRIWLAVYAVLLVVQSILIVRLRPTIKGYGSLGTVLGTTFLYSWVFSPAAWLAFWGWTEALRQRTFAPLAKERGSDLLLSALDPRDLWPALLLGPFVLRVAMTLLASAAGMLTFLYWLFTVGPEDDALSIPMWVLMHVYGSLVALALAALQQAAATAWAARLVHPGGTTGRLLLTAFGVVVAFSTLNAVAVFLSQAVLFERLDLFFPLNMRDQRMPFAHHIAFLPGVVLRLIVYALLFRAALKWLRSPRASEAWKRSLEAG